jgi:hypothetical protein
MGNDTLVAVDLANSVFQIAVASQPGKVTRRERLPRDKFLEERRAARFLHQADDHTEAGDGQRPNEDCTYRGESLRSRGLPETRRVP